MYENDTTKDKINVRKRQILKYKDTKTMQENGTTAQI